MITVTRVDVPEYLRSGDLYRTLSQEEDDAFELPATAFKRDLELQHNDDLKHLLESLRFWIVASPPVELIEYCLTTLTAMNDTKEMLHQYSDELSYANFLMWSVGCRRGHATQVHEALLSGNAVIVEYMLNRLEPPGMPLFLSYSHFCTALEVDNVDCLRLVISKGAPVVGRDVYAHSKACLEYLLDHCPCYEPDFDVYVKHNLIEQVRILIARGYTWTSRTLAACVAKRLLPMLKFLHEQGCSEWAGVTTTACYEEQFDILQYAHEHGAPWDADTTLGGEYIEYVHEHGCPWHAMTLYYLARRGHWKNFKYALEHNCPYHECVAREVAGGSLPILQYLRERGFGWDLQASMQSALDAAKLDVIRYLHTEGAEWPQDALLTIVRRGDLALLTYAHEAGLPLNRSEACTAAVDNYYAGGLDLLRFLHEHGCPWDHTAVEKAKRRGAMDCLTYLLQHGCPSLA
jgi:hypothetical protein